MAVSVAKVQLFLIQRKFCNKNILVNLVLLLALSILLTFRTDFEKCFL